MALSDFNNLRQVAGRLIALSHIKLNVRGRSQVAESHNLDAVLPSHSQKFLLCQVWVHLNLENCRLDSAVVKHLADCGCAHVTEADVANKTVADQLLHCLPRLLESDP